MKKKSILITGLLLIVTLFVQAQNGSSSKGGNTVRINLYGAYAFEDSFDSYYDYGNYYQGTLNGGFMYGLGVEFEASPMTFLELSYQRMDTSAPSQYYNGGLFDQYADFDVAVNYIMLGGNRSFRKPGSKVEGFGGLMAGVGIINIENPSNGNSDSLTKFAWGLKGGATIWATEKVGIKLQAQLMSVAQSVGGGIYFGTGGASTGVSSYSSIYQFTLGGGLVFDLTK